MEKIIRSIPLAFIVMFTFECIGTQQNCLEIAREIDFN